METYEVVHVQPGQSEATLLITTDSQDIIGITETPRYIGTWVKPDRKLLKHGKGELLIKTKQPEQVTRVIGHNVVYERNKPKYELIVKYGGELKFIRIDSGAITGHDMMVRLLWTTTSFTRLADMVGKEVAYQVYLYHEKFLAEFNLEGTI